MQIPNYIFFIMSIVEMGSILLMILSLILKKQQLVLVFMGVKILIHSATIYELFQTIFYPLIEDTFVMFAPMALRQGLTLFILLSAFCFQMKNDYKKVMFAMIVLLGLDVFSIFIYYPMFMDYFMNYCKYCTKDIIGIEYLKLFPSVSSHMIMTEKRAYRLLIWTSSTPFFSGSLRLLISIIESISFVFQYKISRKA